MLGGAPAEDHQHPAARGGRSAALGHASSSARRKSADQVAGVLGADRTRMSPSPMPAASRSSGDSCRCEVVPGCVTSVHRPPNDEPTIATRSDFAQRDAAS